MKELKLKIAKVNDRDEKNLITIKYDDPFFF